MSDSLRLFHLNIPFRCFALRFLISPFSWSLVLFRIFSRNCLPDFLLLRLINLIFLHSTEFDSSYFISLHFNSIQSTQLKSAQVSSTQLNSAQLNSTQLNSIRLIGAQFHSRVIQSISSISSISFRFHSSCPSPFLIQI
jgi:hypothetical protein